MKVGVLGGTFDPIHIGHLIAGEEARIDAGLDRVVFVPAGMPWLKRDHTVSAAEHRTEMVRRAIACNPAFELSLLEVSRSGPSYTLDTMVELHREMGEDAELYLILGLDSFRQLPEWHRPEDLVRMCRLLVVNRAGPAVAGLREMQRLLPGLAGRVSAVRMPEIGISSSAIRDRVQRGLSIRYLVPRQVEEYIREQGLYRSNS